MQSGKIIKGSLALVVLQLLQNNGSMYGYEITRAVREASKGITEITEAALYPTLHKLQNAQLLTVTYKTIDGRERKYYRVTAAGKKEAATQLLAMQEAIAALQKILKYKLNR